MATRATSVQITMPQMGESVTEGTVLGWLKQVGDRVEADRPCGLRVQGAVEQQQLDPGSVPREEAEVGAVAVRRRPQR